MAPLGHNRLMNWDFNDPKALNVLYLFPAPAYIPTIPLRLLPSGTAVQVYWIESFAINGDIREFLLYVDDTLDFRGIAASHNVVRDPLDRSKFNLHDDIIIWKCFPHYWRFVWEEPPITVVRPLIKGPIIMQIFDVFFLASLTSFWINSWVARYLRHHDAHVI